MTKPTLSFRVGRITDPRPHWLRFLHRLIGRHGFLLKVGQTVDLIDETLTITPDHPEYDRYYKLMERQKELAPIHGGSR